MDDRDLPDGVHVGGVFAGRYRIEARLEGGGMGVVARAHHLVLDQSVAIKFLHREVAARSDVVTRFLHEARVAAGLKSKHAVRVLDAAVYEEDVPYIVMEFLRGRDLARRLRDKGALEIRNAVDCILQAADAIAEAHHSGIVHRDIKPANLFLVEEGAEAPMVKVLDFGIAKSTNLVAKTVDLGRSSARPESTQSRAILGSPYYMSPEQMESAGMVDTRTDIWALGVTLYELITGEVPYSGTTLIQVYSRIIADTSQSWRDAWPASAPRGLDAVVGKCLHRHRDGRYRRVRDLIEALSPFGTDPKPASPRTPPLASLMNDVPVIEPVPSVISPRTSIPPMLELEQTKSSPSFRVRRRSRWIGPAIAGFAFVIGVAGIAFRISASKPGPVQEPRAPVGPAVQVGSMGFSSAVAPMHVDPPGASAGVDHGAGTGGERGPVVDAPGVHVPSSPTASGTARARGIGGIAPGGVALPNGDVSVGSPVPTRGNGLWSGAAAAGGSVPTGGAGPLSGSSAHDSGSAAVGTSRGFGASPNASNLVANQGDGQAAPGFSETAESRSALADAGSSPTNDIDYVKAMLGRRK